MRIADSYTSLPMEFPQSNPIIRELKQQRRQLERQIRTSFWLTKQQLCTRNTLFLYIYLPTLNDYEVKLSNYSFYEGRENKRKIFSFFF